MALDPFVVINAGSLAIAFVTALITLKFYRTVKKDDIYTIEMLYKSFAAFGVFQLLLSTRLLYSGLGTTEQTGIVIFAHMFLYISLAYFSRIAAYIYKPEWTEYVFGAVLLVGAVAMHLMISTWSQITPAIAIPSLIVWIGMGTLVFANMARNSEGLERKKMGLMSLGFLMLAISGPAHGIAANGTQYIIVEAMTVLSVLVIFSGVYYGKLLRTDQ